MIRRVTRCSVVIMFLMGHLSCSAQPTGSTSSPATETVPSQEVSKKIDASHDWSRFRGPDGMGNSHAGRLPMSWSETENLVWKTELPGAGGSSPVVFGDHIYLTTWSGYLVPGEPQGDLENLSRHLVCLNKQGEILWRKDIKAKLPEEEQIRDHGYAANTPVVDADYVYAFLGKSGVYAYTHDGEPVWQTDVGDGTHGWGTAASPILHNNLLIINASVESQKLFAIDRKTGDVNWSAEGINEAWNTPLIVKTESGDDELVLAIHGSVLGFNPDSGEKLWTCETDITWYMVPSPVAAEGVVYFLGGRSGTAGLAVRTGGRGNVTQSHRLWTSLKGSNVTSPVLQNGYLYWMNENIGIAYCAKAETGELVYENRVNRAGQVYASSIIGDGKIYHLSRSGRMFVLAAKPEFELLSTNDLSDGTEFNASPVVLGNSLLLRSGKYLYCVGK